MSIPGVTSPRSQRLTAWRVTKSLLGKHLLRKAMRSTYGNKVLGKGHSGSPSSEFLDSASLSGAGSQSKQPFVARGKLAYNWAKPLGPIAPL